MSQKREWRVTIAGECMTCRPFMIHEDPGFLEVLEELKDSDLTYAHLEMNLADYEELEWPAKSDWLGSFMMAEPELAAELKAAGIDLVSTAHNHSFDFGATGLMATNKHLRAAGVVAAGTGRNLEEAREPAYIERRKGRAALVSVSSGNKSYEWATLPKGGLKGRPGVNPLRFSMQYVLPEEQANQIKAIAKQLGVLRSPGRNAAGIGLADGAFGIAMPGEFSMPSTGGFTTGEEFGIVSDCHQRDLDANLRSIDEAANMSDLVIVAHHFNVAEGGRGDKPPAFVRKFAHAAIDGGADMFVGHGWHKTLGIEIYKGKLIIYGIGNFFAQSEFVRRVPYDSYEAWGHDVERLPTLHPHIHPLHPGLDNPSDTWWSSCILKLHIVDNTLVGLRLVPVEMGRESRPGAPQTRRTGKGDHHLTEGRPLRARGEDAVRILERLQRVSSQYGTEIEIVGDEGFVRLSGL